MVKTRLRTRDNLTVIHSGTRALVVSIQVSKFAFNPFKIKSGIELRGGGWERIYRMNSQCLSVSAPSHYYKTVTT